MSLPRTLLACSVLLTLLTSREVAAESRYSFELSRRVVGVSSPRVSPDGRSIAFIVARPD